MSLTVREALSQVLDEMDAMSPEELRAELDKHKAGTMATALAEASQFMKELDETIQHNGPPSLL